MTVVENVRTMQELCQQLRSEGEVLSFVPTMGALHQGHMALVKKASELGSKVVVSIFVNPKQFRPGEDFEKYPRQFPEDVRLLSSSNIFAVFHPTVQGLYEEGFQTEIRAGKLAQGLCGASRPGHFDGVLMVVMKLLNIVNPHFMVMGKKDYQQVKVIDRMMKDYNLTTELVPLETLREANGLAMSSRNQYLSVADKEEAALIFKSLSKIKQDIKAGERRVTRLVDEYRRTLEELDDVYVEYVEFRTQDTFEVVEHQISVPSVCLTAVKFRNVRLIDNIEIGKSA